MNYETEKKIAKSILRIAPLYENMPVGEKRKIESRLKTLNSTTLGFILEEMNEEITYNEFYRLVEEHYISVYATNDLQKKFLKESLEYKRDNLKRMKENTSITKDKYNEGKHCNKFNRRKSLKKKKGKIYAKVRVKNMSF